MSDRLPSVPENVVRRTMRGEVSQLTIDNPPVNALRAAVRRGLLQALEAADADPSARAVLPGGQGANFIAGADIRDFGRTPQPPSLTEVCRGRAENRSREGASRPHPRRSAIPSWTTLAPSLTIANPLHA